MIEQPTDGYVLTRDGAQALESVRFWSNDGGVKMCYVECIAARTGKPFTRAGFHMTIASALDFFTDVLEAYNYIVIEPLAIEKEAKDEN